MPRTCTCACTHRQSLLATRMRTADMVKAAPATAAILANAGSLEVRQAPWDAIQFIDCVID
jgi:pyruvate carboxylase